MKAVIELMNEAGDPASELELLPEFESIIILV